MEEVIGGLLEGFSVINILIFIVIIFLALAVGQFISFLIEFWLKDRRRLAKQISRPIQYVIILGTLYLGLVYVLEFDFGSFLAAFGIIGIAIAFASQQTISNMLAGIYISAYGLIKEGDIIDVRGDVCEVKDISLMNVQAKSSDGKLITIPKSTYLRGGLNNVLVNYTQGGVLRVKIPMDVSNETKLEKISNLLMDICNKDKNILPEIRRRRKIFEKLLQIKPRTKRYDPKVVVKGLSGNYYKTELWVWIYNIKRKDVIISGLLKEVKREFDKQGIKLKPL